MGRHSRPEQGPYYRSVVGWVIPWMLIAAVVGMAVWIGVDLLGGDEVKPTPIANESPTRRPSPSVSPTLVVVETPDEEPTEEPEPEESGSPKAELITEDITVQVLNGTADLEADDRMADRLAQLGFTIVAVEGSSKTYDETTVFWSYPEAEEAAKALAARFDWVAEQKPANLSETVALHVVVGADEV